MIVTSEQLAHTRNLDQKSMIESHGGHGHPDNKQGQWYLESGA